MCQANKCIDKLMRWVLIVFMVVMSVLMIVFFLRAEIPALKVLPQRDYSRRMFCKGGSARFCAAGENHSTFGFCPERIV